MELKAALVVIIQLLCYITPILSTDDTSQVEQNMACTGRKAVHFYAAHPSEIDGKLELIPFPDVTLNEGFAFSGASGIFTAPVNGIYQFFFSFQSTRSNSNNHWCLKVNDVSKVICHSQISQGDTVGSMCTYMAELAQNDKVTANMELKAALVLIIPLMCHITPILSHDDEVEQSSAPCPGPRAVHFYAANPSPIDGHMDPIPFPDVTVNVGFAFSGASGIFTAPVNGIYQFYFSTQSGRDNMNNLWYLKVNGVSKV
ncbi:hypothetical protein ACEWY4_002363 [Coilia grayii]|uniref:C1q domain-containing protein n=1 Tax=Coilia grayii TaxID=363190 RepID=A0ABD1KNA1_9TELE